MKRQLVSDGTVTIERTRTFSSRELILAPVEALVSREQHVVRRLLIVRHDED
jgi:hypothetical protein